MLSLELGNNHRIRMVLVGRNLLKDIFFIRVELPAA